jgi:NhaA family Na+:H+ antiporter
MTKLFSDFFHSEKAGGIMLIFVTALSLWLANSGISTQYISFWQQEFSGHTITHWTNDGLMTVFFLLIGLELEREIYQGELSDMKKAALPLLGALGGMLVPAAFYLVLNFGTETQSGGGIPMATDIAFAIGILSLLGNRIPISLKIFLTALAVIDDLGAIIVIGIFYTKTIAFADLAISLGLWGVLLALNRLKIRNLAPYLLGGIAMWYFMLHSGIHATITGVLLAFAIPFGNGDEKSSSFILQRFLHYPVAFIVLPLFAAANTCISLESNWYAGLTSATSMGIFLGLCIGKPLGIFSISYIGVKTGMCRLPSDINWKQLVAVGILGGIGFTMSIFIALLAFSNEIYIQQSKIAILAASVVSALSGLLMLQFVFVRKRP